MHGALGQSGISTLSDREREVVRLAADGFTDHSICKTLGISAGTLGTYWARVRSKTGLTSRPELAAAFARHNYESVLISTVGMIAEKSVPYGTHREKSAHAAIEAEIFEHLPIAVIVVNEDGIVVSLNALAADILESRTDQPENLMSLISQEDSNSMLEAFREAQQSKEPFQFEATVLANSGPKKCHWYARKLSDRSGCYLLVLSESLRNSSATARSRAARHSSLS